MVALNSRFDRYSRRRCSALALLAVVAGFLFVPRASNSQEYPDSCMASPQSPNSYHLHTPTTSPFKRVFNLHMSDRMDVTGTPWSQDSINVFTRGILDTTGAPNLARFKRIWDFFCYTDAASADDSVSYKLRSLPSAVTVHKIDLNLYHKGDFTGGNEYECYGYYNQGTQIFVNGGCASTGSPPKNPSVVLQEFQFPHELAHLCDYANVGAAFNGFPDATCSEMMSTGAEYVAGDRFKGWRPPRSPEYDATLMYGNSNNYHNAPWQPSANLVIAPYEQYRMFMTYLFTHHSGYSSADSSSLLYRWIRNTSGDTLYGADRTRFTALGNELMKAPFKNQLPGSRAAEKLGNLIHRFGMAKYADDPTYLSGRYGFGSEVTAESFFMFEWVDTNFARARTIPPTIIDCCISNAIYS